MILNLFLFNLSMILKLVWFCGGCASKGTLDAHFPQGGMIH